MSDLRERATQRLEQALRDSGAADPRPRLRDLLRAVREKDADAFRRASQHFEDVVTPALARGDGDPIGEWLDYGRLLASMLVEGETYQIDPSGLSTAYSRPVGPQHMVLHLPKSPRIAAIAVAMPPEVSPAQQATYALLVEEAVRLP